MLIEQQHLLTRCKSSSSGEVPPIAHADSMEIDNATFIKNPKAVRNVTQTFLKAGFTEENCAKIIDDYPNILCIRPKDLEVRLEIWTKCNFSRPQYYQLFVQCPELLEYDDENAIAKRFGQLLSVVATPKNVWRLLMASPNVLVDDASLILKKIDYVVRKMEADVTDLVKSGTLGLTLKTIQTRHVLLQRLGLYKKRNWKESELSTNKNPRLFRIMDSSDEEFAIKLCGISMKEFAAFCDLYERELDELAEDRADYDDLETDSDDDWDSDDEEFDAREKNDYYDDRHRRRYVKGHRHRKAKK